MNSLKMGGLTPLRTSFVLAAALVVTGCATSVRQNTEFFSSGDEMVSIAKTQLSQGLSKEEVIDVLTKDNVFDDLGEDVSDRWIELKASEINDVICGCDLAVTSIEERDRAAEDMRGMEGYEFTYINIKERGAKIPGRDKKLDGDKRTFQVVFKDDKLVAWRTHDGPVRKRSSEPLIKDVADVIGIAL